jgi:hypothetical protein
MWSNKYPILKRNPVVDGYIVLDFDVIPQANLKVNINTFPDNTIFPQLNFFSYLGLVPDARPLAYGCIR